MWRAAGIAVADVATGEVTQIHKSIFAPGRPPGRPMVSASRWRWWRPSTRNIAKAPIRCSPCPPRHARNPDEKWFAPEPNMSIDSRGWNGPVWSPDGAHMLAIYEGQLAIWPVSPLTGEPQGPVRHLTSEIAYNPSWAADNRHVLYQSNDKLRLMDPETGDDDDRSAGPHLSGLCPQDPYGHPCRQAGGWRRQDRTQRYGHRDRGQSHHRASARMWPGRAATIEAPTSPPCRA